MILKLPKFNFLLTSLIITTVFISVILSNRIWILNIIYDIHYLSNYKINPDILQDKIDVSKLIREDFEYVCLVHSYRDPVRQASILLKEVDPIRASRVSKNASFLETRTGDTESALVFINGNLQIAIIRNQEFYVNNEGCLGRKDSIHLKSYGQKFELNAR